MNCQLTDFTDNFTLLRPRITQKLAKVKIYECAICIDTYFIGHTMGEMMATKYIYVSFRLIIMSTE